jgi:hypothetical protein
MYCPECGNEAGDAKFCPECGADLSGVKSALQSKTTGGKTTGQQGRKGGERPAATPPAKPAGRGLSPAVIWGIVAVVAAAVIVAVILLMPSGSDSGASSPGDGSSAPVSADTSGSYDELVQRANGLYDQGDAAFQSQDLEKGSSYFQSAAMVYAAAWSKQQNDPNVGTDLATALFYSGNIDAALQQIDSVIKKFPDFQPAYYNLGNYLTHSARIAEQAGKDKQAAKDYAAARAAYTKAIALDPKSDIGKQADERLQALPK